MENQNVVHVSNGGIGFTGVLFITFLVLKLTHVINWSWWLVTAPLWGPIALIIAVCIIVFMISVMVGFFNFIFEKNNTYC